MIPIVDTPAGASFAVKVHPRAKKNAVTGEIGDAFKLALTAPPVEGRANDACIEFFANLLKVPRSSVTIASGKSSRRKSGVCVWAVGRRSAEAVGIASKKPQTAADDPTRFS